MFLKIRTRIVPTFALSAVIACQITITKFYDGIDPINDNFKGLRDRRDKNGESCDDEDSSTANFKWRRRIMCHLYLSDGRAGKNEMDVFLLHLVRSFVCSSPPFVLCRVSLQNTKNDWWPWKLFRSVGTVHTKGLHSNAALLYYGHQRFPSKRGASPPKLLARSLTRPERKKTHPPSLEHEIWRDSEEGQGELG